MTKQVKLSEQLTFKSKSAAEDHFRKILHSYAPGAVVGDADTTTLKLLLENHPNMEEKIGIGIAGFKVDFAPADKYGNATRCFWTQRPDGSGEAFSIDACLKRF